MMDVSIELLCNNQHGILSRVIREMKILGLVYKQHKIEEKGGNTIITFKASGEPNCNREGLEEALLKSNGVMSVRSMRFQLNGKDIERFRTKTVNSSIHCSELLTPVLLLSAEKRLSEILGPLASLLVEDAAKKSNNVGELYELLSKDLDDDQERAQFLSIVEK